MEDEQEITKQGILPETFDSAQYVRVSGRHLGQPAGTCSEMKT
jgi:hypothetical protein